MAEDPHDLEYDLSQFAVEFTYAVMFWNHVEMTARQILQLVLGEGVLTLGLSAELGNRTLGNTLRMAANEEDFSDVAEHLVHFCNGFDRLLGYRNYYVHGLFAALPVSRSGKRVTLHGQITGFDGKGRARVYNENLSLDQLKQFVEHLKELVAYGAAIQAELGAEGTGLRSLLGMPEPSLQKPQWPPQLKKHLVNLQEH